MSRYRPRRQAWHQDPQIQQAGFVLAVLALTILAVLADHL